MDGIGRYICVDKWNVMYSEVLAEECLEEQQQRLNQHDKQVHVRKVSNVSV